jgi:hypothetical protein
MHNGRVYADRVGEGKQLGVDSFEKQFQVLCPSCQGLGATPGGDRLTEDEAVEIIAGHTPHGWDSVEPLETCRECDGDGVIADDDERNEDDYR